MNIDELMRRLFELYPKIIPMVLGSLFVLISTLMSHRTRESVTYPAARKLFERFSTPEEMIETEIGEIKTLIRDVGFYRVKAGRIKDISGILLEKYDCKTARFLMIWNLSLNFQESAGRKLTACLPMLSLKTPLQWILTSIEFPTGSVL
jgi:endonuclease III